MLLYLNFLLGTDLGFRLYDPDQRGLPAIEVEDVPTMSDWGPMLPMPRVDEGQDPG